MNGATEVEGAKEAVTTPEGTTTEGAKELTEGTTESGGAVEGAKEEVTKESGTATEGAKEEIAKESTAAPDSGAAVKGAKEEATKEEAIKESDAAVEGEPVETIEAGASPPADEKKAVTKRGLVDGAEEQTPNKVKEQKVAVEPRTTRHTKEQVC